MTIKPIHRNQATQIIVPYHYLHSLGKVSVAFGLFTGGRCVGAATFGQPSGRGVAQYLGVDEAECLELLRLCVFDDFGRNTESFFIAQTIKQVKKINLRLRVLIAYADSTVGHLGYVYQASNWLYLGKTGRKYHYRDQSGQYINKRVPWDYAKKHGISEAEVAKTKNLTRFDELPKHRYVFPLNHKDRKKLAKRVQKYPKACVPSIKRDTPATSRKAEGSSLGTLQPKLAF